MLVMACVTYKYDTTAAFTELGVAVGSSVIVFVFTFRFRRHVDRTIKGIFSGVSEINRSFLERFKMPVVATGKYGDILWSNSRFKKQLCLGRNPLNESIATYLGDREIETVADSEGFELDLNGNHYTVFCTAVSDGYICYYIDNTNYYDVYKKFNDTRKSVALIVFDNREEFSSNSEEESAAVLLELESKLLHYASDNNAFYKKLPSNRYMIIFDKVNLDRQIAEKFPILKEVRGITFNNSVATISIGIGCGCDTLVESEKKARKALDMALGRGGDQVAVTKDATYEFFGGVSAGIEKMSKVRSRVIATSISRVISESDRVLIMGHRFSDLDSVGAAVGLQPVIRDAFKKPCYVVINKQTSMAKSLIELVEADNRDVFITPEEAAHNLSVKTLMIIVDTHIPDFVESPELLSKCRKVVVIDHHRKNVNYIDDALVFFHEPTVSSASEMVTELITYLGENCVSRLQAEALLSGIMLDTKNFVLRTGVRTFEAAAFLRKKGADTVETKELFSSSLETHKKKYKIVDNAEIVCGCAVAATLDEDPNIRMVAAQAADELLTVENVAASFVIFASDGVLNISARSYGRLNVQLVMEVLGGGGHQNMAAAQLSNITLSEAREKLIAAIRVCIEDN